MNSVLNIITLTYYISTISKITPARDEAQHKKNGHTKGASGM